jgi:hypothetical protein
MTIDLHEWRAQQRKKGGTVVVPLPFRPRLRLLPFAIGLGLAATSLSMNLTYAIGQSSAWADKISLAAGAGLIEALAIVMPSLALDLGRQRQRFASTLCALIAAGAIALATWSNLDYIRQTSGDHTALRSAIAEQRSAIAAQRSQISEARSVAELSAALLRLRLPPWASAETSACSRPGSPAAERFCAPHHRLSEARAAAIHRDELDASLRSLPPLAPVSPSALRVILFALVPGALAGPVLMLARW